MTLVPRPAFADFARHYGGLDYTGAVVLDIGADYGVTPEFFLSRGAVKVIAVERLPDRLAGLREWAIGKPVEVVDGLTIDNAETLLQDHRPDIVKVDCEGCERHLLALPHTTLGGPKAWVMETHSLGLYVGFLRVFRELGYEVEHVEHYHHLPPERHRKVFTARRLK